MTAASANPRGDGAFTVRLVTPGGVRPALDVHGRTTTAAPPIQLVRIRRMGTLSKLFVALAVLQLLDLASTLLLRSIGGVEANPLSASLLAHGVATFAAAKLGLALALVAFVPWLERHRQPPGTVKWTAFGLDAVYTMAVLANTVQFVIFA